MYPMEGHFAPLAWLQSAIVLLTAAGLFQSKDVKQIISDVGVEYASAIDYLAYDRQKAIIVGNLAGLLEAIVESSTEYRKIHVLAYSFGSIVAIDALYQRREPPERFKRINSLVTVGSPFDIVRSFWPAYYQGRHGRPGKSSTWLNVYSPDDVFSSNFRNDGKDVESGVGVEVDTGLFAPRNILFDWTERSKRRFLLERLQRIRHLHMIYWGGGPTAQTFLDDVVRRIYSDDVALN